MGTQARNGLKLPMLCNRNEFWTYPANIYLFKVNNRNTWKQCEICSKLTKSNVSTVGFEQVNVGWVDISKICFL